MADRLHFSLVSPERELFTDEVDAVQVPGSEGIFEVMAGHSPVMSTLSPGFVVIRQGGSDQRFYVRGGFADVTSGSLTILAEVAVPEGELKGDVLAQEKEIADQQIAANDLDPDDAINAHRAADILRAV